MKILVIGGNTNADLISQHLSTEDNVEHVYHHGAHSSAVQTNRYTPLPIDKSEVALLVDFINSPAGKDLDLIVPTTLYFQFLHDLSAAAKKNNIPVMMPGYSLGNLEYSKITGKRLLNHLKIPTPGHKVMPHKEFFDSYFDIKRPFVVKYEKDWRSGLQTIVITEKNYQEEFANLTSAPPRTFMSGRARPADMVFVVEDYIDGEREYSWHAACNTTGWTFLGAARDYKKRYEGDVGHNTASMGSYAPVQDVDSQINVYADRIVNFLKQRGTPYVGILYLGIMVDKNGKPHVLEINTRPGSPEIESILQTIDENVADLFYRIATNQPLPAVKFNDKVGVSIRIINKVYKEHLPFEQIDWPQLWPMVDGIQSSMCADARLLHSVLTVSDTSIDAASDRLYKFLKNKHLGDFTYRTDIGYCK